MSQSPDPDVTFRNQDVRGDDDFRDDHHTDDDLQDDNHNSSRHSDVDPPTDNDPSDSEHYDSDQESHVHRNEPDQRIVFPRQSPPLTRDRRRVRFRHSGTSETFSEANNSNYYPDEADHGYRTKIPNIPSQIMKPDTYSGNDNFEEYLSHFEDCAELSGWDRKTTVLVLAASLRGQARTFYMSLSSSERRDYRQLVTAMSNRFGSSKHQTKWLAKLESRRRNRGENIAALGDDRRHVAQKAYSDLDTRAREKLALNHPYKLISVEIKCR